MTNETGNGKAPDMDSILGRVRAALHLSRNAANEHEAAAAIAAVQRIMFRYNLEMADVEAHADKGAATASDMVHDDVQYGAFNERNKEWKRDFAYAVARYNFCKALTGRYDATFIGRKHDVDVVKEIYAWVIEQAVRLAQEAWNNLDPDAKRWEMQITFKGSFYHGLRHTVTTRMRLQYEELTRATTKSTALVAMTGKEIDVYTKAKLKVSKRSYHPDRMNEFSRKGHDAGAAAGNNVTLARPKRIKSQPRLAGGR